jgi:hypothetical protein
MFTPLNIKNDESWNKCEKHQTQTFPRRHHFSRLYNQFLFLSPFPLFPFFSFSSTTSLSLSLLLLLNNQTTTNPATATNKQTKKWSHPRSALPFSSTTKSPDLPNSRGSKRKKKNKKKQKLFSFFICYSSSRDRFTGFFLLRQAIL